MPCLPGRVESQQGFEEGPYVMAELIRHKHVPKTCRIYCTSDQHIGARAWHKEAHEEFVQTVKDDALGFWIHNGDALEGKPTKSKHFDPNTLRPGLITVEAQAEEAVRLHRPIADKCLSWGAGNHDIYLAPDFDINRYMAEQLGVPKGGYQTWIDLGFLRIFAYHGRRNMPRGAKDRIQRDANQRAWLKRTLEDLAGNCHVMLHGHVHTLHVQPPIDHLALLARGNSVRARHFTQPTQTVATRDPATGKVDSREYIPTDSRWYAVTGTFRRSGGFGYTDYAEIGGYAPGNIGYQIIHVEDGVVQDITPVVV